MARNNQDQSISQKYEASSIDSKRRMNKKAKTGSNKKDRQKLKKDLEKEINED